MSDLNDQWVASRKKVREEFEEWLTLFLDETGLEVSESERKLMHAAFAGRDGFRKEGRYG